MCAPTRPRVRPTPIDEAFRMELEGIVRAPDFPDTLDWIHAGGRRLTLADFRGKLLLLDFWTYG
jgi:hypothetical protein